VLKRHVDALNQSYRAPIEKPVVSGLACRNRKATSGRAPRVSFVAEDVFNRFIAAAPVKIHSGLLQPRPEWGAKS